VTMFNALVTDASYKKRGCARPSREKGDPRFTGSRDTTRPHGALARAYRCYDAILTGMSPESALRNGSFDMVIPVGGTSV
jgi:hypothetical protein